MKILPSRILAALLLVAAASATSCKSILSIKSPTGTPLGLSARTPNHIATLIQTLEPYVPSLNRNAGGDRYRLTLLLSPLEGRSPVRLVPIAKGLSGHDFSLVKLLGCDGKTVWFQFNGIGGVDLKSGRIIGSSHLLRANPALGERWDDSRRIDFDQRLRLTTPDRKQLFEVTPDTLQAIPAQPSKDRAKLPFDARVDDFLASGVRPTPTDWLGLHSPKDAALHYKPNSHLSRFNSADDAKELRRFYHAQLGPELDRGNRQILLIESRSSDEYLNAAFVRAASQGDPLRLSAPDSFLMIYTANPSLGATTMLARVDDAGKLLWKVDTGIDRFKLSQILPDASLIAFIGTRSPAPDKLAEPILVVVDVQSGTASTGSLWK